MLLRVWPQIQTVLRSELTKRLEFHGNNSQRGAPASLGVVIWQTAAPVAASHPLPENLTKTKHEETVM